MKKDRENTESRFWSRWAWLYDRFMRKDKAAYEKMYEHIRTAVRGKDVLELATGTGLIAKNIVHDARSVEATDAAPEMIAEAKKKNTSSKLHFSIQDIFRLPYADGSFPVVIASNVLHIIPEPEKAIAEMKRVLSMDGVLILPTFTHGDMGIFAKGKAKIMQGVGFPLHSTWVPDTYKAFLEENGLEITYNTVLKASFPLTYVECKRGE